ncbi:hypothetical protein FHX71_000334 [Promicromonospora sukumoe]|uniref:Uncharacterized protein n=1 Tax=Promicromonospora sukumoe TaxID=88382 RepID=A0A7W3J540_9MICO|nr:hypothetical protein [Promicromonospora sukumoe]
MRFAVIHQASRTAMDQQVVMALRENDRPPDTLTKQATCTSI